MCQLAFAGEVVAMFATKRKKRYRDYLEPGAEFLLPDSTKRSRNNPNQREVSDEEDNGGNSPVTSDNCDNASTSVHNHEPSTSVAHPHNVSAVSSDVENMNSTSEDEDLSSGREDRVTSETFLAASPSGISNTSRNSEDECTLQSEQESDAEQCVNDHLRSFVVTEVQEDLGSASRKDSTNYVEKYKLNDRVGPVTITKTKFEILVMIFHIVMRHGMTGKFIEDMVKLVNELIGQDYIPVFKYLFHKIFEPKLQMQFHFFCEQCELYLGVRGSFKEKTLTCPNCKKECNVHNLDNYDFFISLPLKPQLEALASKPGIEFLLNQSKSPPNLCDITDGILFKKLYDEKDITITFNSDGAEAFHTGQYSLWPLQAFVNNLPPTERFRGENVIVCGLWFGKKSPNFVMFLKAFNEEMIMLAKDGIRTGTSIGARVNRPVFASNCSVDSVAKPKLQMMKQFNGRFGCGYCLHPGDLIPLVRNSVRYLAKEYPLRTDASMRNDMYKADELERAGQLRKSRTTVDHVNGLKGLSPLILLPKFDICYGFVIDYMHGVLLGVTSKLIELWFKFKHDCIESGRFLFEVDKRLVALTPPSNNLIRPRPLCKYTDFKAKEFRPLLVYYILPCILNVLKTRHFNNVRDFATAIYILLKDCISPTELDEADRLLRRFVKEYNHLYGDEHMTYNVHLCTHLVTMVKMWGPLWAYSNFSFEAGNGNLLKHVEGTRGVATQLALKYCMARTIADAMIENDVCSDVLDFCSDIVSVG